MSATVDAPMPADPGADLRLVVPGRGLSAGSGWTWIAEGWKLFARSPLMWIVAVLIVFVISIVLHFIPILGSLVFQLLQAVFAAGFMVACRRLERGGDFELEHVFAGFRIRFANLLVVGLLYLAGMIVILMVFAAFVGFSILGAVMSGNYNEMGAAILASMGAIALGGLVCVALMIPLVAAFWFAPALVVMHGMAPTAAMKESFYASFRNFVPFLVYGIVMLVFAVIAVIPIGLGMLVWVPVAIASTYAAYRAIFTDDAAPAPAVAFSG